MASFTLLERLISDHQLMSYPDRDDEKFNACFERAQHLSLVGSDRIELYIVRTSIDCEWFYAYTNVCHIGDGENKMYKLTDIVAVVRRS